MLVRLVTRRARGTVADVDAQLGEELVTLLAPVGGQLGPHGVAGPGHGGLWRWERLEVTVPRTLPGPSGLLLHDVPTSSSPDAGTRSTACGELNG